MAAHRLDLLLNERDTDSDLSDSDDDELLIYDVRRPRWIRERNSYFEEYDDVDFKTRFRLSKESVLSVLDHIEHQLEFPTDRNVPISPINQLLGTLRFYATGSSQLECGDFGGYSKSSAHRIIHRVSSAIARLSSEYIRFPTTREEIVQEQKNFYGLARFPLAVGALDCTHIKISSPGGPYPEYFRNRKGYFSLNVQGICNTNLEFTDLVARWPGSAHDSHIFNNCRRRSLFEQGLYDNAILLVDAGYACKSYLMPPLENPQTPEEHLYNESQIRSRNPIERLFGVWKRRFPVLTLGMRVNFQRVLPIVIATAVLHNISRQLGDGLPQDDPHLRLPAPWEDLLQEGEIAERAAQRQENSVQQLMIRNYFKSLLPAQ